MSRLHERPCRWTCAASRICRDRQVHSGSSIANLEKELSTGGCANVNTLFGEMSRAGGGCRESDINLAQNMRMGADTSSGCALLRSVDSLLSSTAIAVCTTVVLGAQLTGHWWVLWRLRLCFPRCRVRFSGTSSRVMCRVLFLWNAR
jgi:hypothetical protein